jgi:hypothetical protein
MGGGPERCGQWPRHVIRARPRVRWLLLSALSGPMAASMAPSMVWAAKPPPGADLLEFLGSVDSDDGSWSQYLGSTDLDQVVKPGAPKSPGKAAKPPAPTPAPPSPRAPGTKAGT